MTKLEYFILASFWAAAVLVLAQFSLELNELLRIIEESNLYVAANCDYHNIILTNDSKPSRALDNVKVPQR